jgi:hypothetical protein
MEDFTLYDMRQALTKEEVDFYTTWHDIGERLPISMDTYNELLKIKLKVLKHLENG